MNLPRRRTAKTEITTGSYTNTLVDILEEMSFMQGEFTFAAPAAFLSLPLPLGSSMNPKLCFPSRFPSIVHVRAKVSSV